MILKAVFLLLQAMSALAYLPMGMNVIISRSGGGEPITYTTENETDFTGVDFIANIARSNACVGEMMLLYIENEKYQPMVAFLESMNEEWSDANRYEMEERFPNQRFHLNVHVTYDHATGNYSPGEFSVSYEGKLKINTYTTPGAMGCDIGKILGDVALSIYEQNIADAENM